MGSALLAPEGLHPVCRPGHVKLILVFDSLQLTAKHKVPTPVNWQQSDDVIIAGPVSDDEAKQTYPEGWKAPRPYIQIVPQPR